MNLKTIEHFIWAVAVVICVTVFVFRPQHPPAPVGPVATTDSSTQTLAKTVQGVVDEVRALKEAKGGADAFSAGLSAASYNWLAAAGRTPTVTVYSAAYKPPTPGPVPTLSPVTQTGLKSGLPVNFEAWHHADTVAAMSETLKKTPIDLHIDQVPTQPNKIAAVYTNDGATGILYAIARHKQLDLDIGGAKGVNGLEALAGYGYNIPKTDAGFFAGVAVGKSPSLAQNGGVQFGFKVGVTVHP